MNTTTCNTLSKVMEEWKKVTFQKKKIVGEEEEEECHCDCRENWIYSCTACQEKNGNGKCIACHKDYTNGKGCWGCDYCGWSVCYECAENEEGIVHCGSSLCDKDRLTIHEKEIWCDLGGLEGIKKIMKKTDWEDVLTQRVSTLLGPPSSAGLLTYNAQGSESLARLGELYYSVLTASNDTERQVYGTNIEEIISNTVDTGAIAMRGQFLEDEIQPAKPSIVRGQGVRDEVLVTPEKRGPQTPTTGQPSRRSNTPEEETKEETKEEKKETTPPSKYAFRKSF